MSSLVLPAPTSTTRRPVEPVEHLLRERGSGGRDGRRALADRGLDPRAPAGVERHPERAVEQRARRARLERVAHLAENLPLAGNHRVEPGGDPEEVERGRLVGEAVRDGRERARVVPGEREQRPVGTRRERARRRPTRGRARCGCRSRGRPPRS